MSDELPGIDVSALAKMPLKMSRVRYAGCEVWVVEQAFGRMAEFATEADAAFHITAREALAAMEMGCRALCYKKGVWFVKGPDDLFLIQNEDNVKARDGMTAMALAYRVLKERKGGA